MGSTLLAEALVLGAIGFAEMGGIAGSGGTEEDCYVGAGAGLRCGASRGSAMAIQPD